MGTDGAVSHISVNSPTFCRVVGLFVGLLENKRETIKDISNRTRGLKASQQTTAFIFLDDTFVNGLVILI